MFGFWTRPKRAASSLEAPPSHRRRRLQQDTILLLHDDDSQRQLHHQRQNNRQVALSAVLQCNFLDVRTQLWRNVIDGDHFEWLAWIAGTSNGVDVILHDIQTDCETKQPITTPLAYAIYHKHWSIVEWLLVHGKADPNYYPLAPTKEDDDDDDSTTTTAALE